MRVLVDTSVWVDFFSEHNSPQARTLAAYLRAEDEIATCGVIAAEFFQGLRDPGSIRTLRPMFAAMEWLAPREPETYCAAAALYRELRASGITVRSTIDCLIARVAEENGAALLSRDRDIRFILESGLCGAQPAPLLT